MKNEQVYNTNTEYYVSVLEKLHKKADLLCLRAEHEVNTVQMATSKLELTKYQLSYIKKDIDRITSLLAEEKQDKVAIKTEDVALKKKEQIVTKVDEPLVQKKSDIENVVENVVFKSENEKVEQQQGTKIDPFLDLASSDNELDDFVKKLMKNGTGEIDLTNL